MRGLVLREGRLLAAISAFFAWGSKRVDVGPAVTYSSAPNKPCRTGLICDAGSTVSRRC